jgi:hypothetical protein
MAYAIAVLESTSTGVPFEDTAVNEERQGWPDIQALHRHVLCITTNLQIEATWRSENEASPPSTHVYQRLPRLDLPHKGLVQQTGTQILISDHIEIEYF